MASMMETLGVSSIVVDNMVVNGLDDTSVDDGTGTQDGGGVSGDSGTEQR
jgi:hypothetical protein